MKFGDLRDVRIFIIGGLGYPEDREWWRTPVYELKLHTMEIQPREFRNEEPGWIYKHEATLVVPHRIRVSGGSRIDESSVEVPNDRIFDLDLDKGCWERVTH